MVNEAPSIDWQKLAGGMLDAFVQHHDIKMGVNKGISSIVASCDTVMLDFSAWTYEGLNENTTSFIFGIPPGSLQISGSDVSTPDEITSGAITALPFNAESGQLIVNIYQWCVAQARAAGKFEPTQRRFRFEHGRYSGSWALPSVGMAFRYMLEGWNKAA